MSLEKEHHLQSGPEDASLLQNQPVHQYEPGELIPLQPQALWYVNRGLVKLTTLTEQNKDVLIGLIGPGMPFGHYLTSLSLFEATALSDVELASISIAEIVASPHLTKLFLRKQVNGFGKLRHYWQSQENDSSKLGWLDCSIYSRKRLASRSMKVLA